MKRIVSIEEDRVVYLEGKQTEKGLYIGNYTYALFPDSSNGEEKLEAALSELDRICRLRGKNVTVVLPLQGILFRELYLPQIKKEKQLQAGILNEMLYYHSNIEEYTVTYLENGHTTESGQRGYFTYAVRNTELASIRRIFDKRKIKHMEITMMPDCLAKLAGLYYPSEELVLILDLCQTHIELCLIEKSCCVMSRRIGLKYENFAGNAQVFAAELADQVSRISQFQRTRYGENTLHCVFVTGTLSEMDQLLLLLQAELDAIRPSELKCLPFDFQTKISFPSKRPPAIVQPPKAAGALLRRK